MYVYIYVYMCKCNRKPPSGGDQAVREHLATKVKNISRIFSKNRDSFVLLEHYNKTNVS